jgi:hypothetical protein
MYRYQQFDIVNTSSQVHVSLPCTFDALSKYPLCIFDLQVAYK